MQPASQPPPADDPDEFGAPDPGVGFDPIGSTSAVLLVVGLTVGVVLAWSVPLVATLLVWPWLFAIPGWVIVRRAVPHLPRPGAVGVSVVTSTYLSAHLVDLVSRFGGFGRAAVILAVLVLAIATVAYARVRHPWLAPLRLPRSAEVPAAIGRAIREDRAAWFIAFMVGGLVYAVLASNAWRSTPDGFVSGGWDWSDFLVHVAIGNSLIHGNFPPEVPYAAGEPLTYHWFADFHGAITASAADVAIIPVYLASSALFASVLALLVWALAMVLTRRPRVAAIATILVCVGGGMGWIRLVGDVVAGAPDIGGLVRSNPYDNSWEDGWPYFRIASVFGTGFLPHRATTFGLPGLVAAILLFVACLGRRPAGVLLAGILAALLAPFHFYAFPATYLIAGLYVLTTRGWRSPTAARDAALFLGPMVLALPYVLPVVLRQSDVDAFRFVLGWSEARLRDGPAAAVFFYVTNLGLPVLLAIGAIVGARDLRTRPFLGAWVVALFLVPNLVVVSAVEFDMNKYFQMMWIPVAILAAWLIRDWPAPAIAAVLAFSALSPGLIAVWHATNPAVVMSHDQEAAARWIESNTPPRTVFVTEAFINSPVDLAGRLRITSFGPYVANLGYDPAPREAAVRSIYCDGPEAAAEQMARYGATYVLSPGGFVDCEAAAGDGTDFDSSDRFETVFERGAVRVWRLHGAA